MLLLELCAWTAIALLAPSPQIHFHRAMLSLDLGNCSGSTAAATDTPVVARRAGNPATIAGTAPQTGTLARRE